MAGLSVQFNPYNAVRIELEDSILALALDRFQKATDPPIAQERAA